MNQSCDSLRFDFEAIADAKNYYDMLDIRGYVRTRFQFLLLTAEQVSSNIESRTFCRSFSAVMSKLLVLFLFCSIAVAITAEDDVDEETPVVAAKGDTKASNKVTSTGSKDVKATKETKETGAQAASPFTILYVQAFSIYASVLVTGEFALKSE